MRRKTKIEVIIIALGIIFAFLSITNYNRFNDQDGSIEIRDEANLESLKRSGGYTESFIHIDGNWSYTVGNYSWCSGDGSWSNPYIIENVTIDASTSPTGSGILISNSKNEYFKIRNCTVYNAGSFPHAGIKLENTNKGTLTLNDCSNNGFQGIYLLNNCDNNTISGNTANNNNYFGIYLWDNCNNNNISGNTANDNSHAGIELQQCNNNIISGNTACNNMTSMQDHGISLLNCNYNNITGNTINNNIDNGMYLESQSDNNVISGNTANGNHDCGIYILYDCIGNFIVGNTINDNHDFGIWLYTRCNNNTISGNIASNNITTNQNHGIYLSDNCDNNIITKNALDFNDQYGVLLRTGSNDNLIYFNSFIGNGYHARDEGINNRWDNGGFGNYWDDYSGEDLFPKDGIGDTPYSLPVDKYDTKPLMYFGWDTDGDTFGDSDEVSYGTNPLDPLWYPMPNLKVSHFSSVVAYKSTSFMLDFSISNDGIWRAEGVVAIVSCEELGMTLFNNTNSPFNLDVDDTEYISIGISPFESIGTFTLNLTIDPDNSIAETYSNKDGSLRPGAENDNFQTTELTILPEIKVLNLAFETQSFSIDVFNISFFIYDDNDQYIDFATIQLWWNGANISNDVQNLGNGLYFVSLELITVAPGEDPILLKMIISASGYEDKTFETHIAVDPDTLEKDVGKGAKEFPLVIILIAVLSTIAGIAVVAVTIVLLRKRKRVSEVI